MTPVIGIMCVHNVFLCVLGDVAATSRSGVVMQPSLEHVRPYRKPVTISFEHLKEIGCMRLDFKTIFIKMEGPAITQNTYISIDWQ